MIKLANKRDQRLYEAEIKDLKELGVQIDNLETADKPQGTLLGWNSVEPVALTGLLNLILCLILANGRSLPEGKR